MGSTIGERTPRFLRWGLPLALFGGTLACGSSSGPAAVPLDAGYDAPNVVDAAGEASAPGDAGDGADAVDAGALDSAPPPTLINVAPDKWTWVDFPGSRCGIGTPTGIGVNPHAGATHLVFFLQGGGACFDGPTCWGANASASYMNGYGAADFAGDPTVLLAPFQRNDAGNPFKDAIYVFVPYCTGDVHVGAKIANYPVNGSPMPTYHYGGHNVDLFLASVAASFTGLSRVWVMGLSAGGFGSFLNQDFAARALPGVRVDVIDDSGPPIDIAIGVPAQWGPRLPPGCTNCTNLSEIFAFDRTTYPTTRYGLLTYQTDDTLPSFYLESEQQFAQQIQQFVTSLGSDPNTGAFVALSSGHVVLSESDTTAAPFILPWLTKMATDDPTWSTEQH
jgi:hypothetical protein